MVLLLSRQIKLSTAVLTFAGFMFAGSFTVTPRAFAEEKVSPADCAAKCDADEKKCLDAQSSEELCDYDKKMCKKACGEQ